MIETDLLQWLVADPAVSTALGGQKVYFHYAPEDPSITLPWVVFHSRPSGRRQRLSGSFTDLVSEFVFDCEHTLPKAGREMAELVRVRLENYRGDMGTSDDVRVTCSPVWTEDGYSGSYSFRFIATVRYRVVRTTPV